MIKWEQNLIWINKTNQNVLSLLIQVWTQKCAVQKASVDVNIINLKKKFMDTGSWIFFNRKLILDYYFCLKSGPVVFISNFHHSHPPLGYKIVSLIIN